VTQGEVGETNTHEIGTSWNGFYPAADKINDNVLF
jgi:hypothetical protein